MNNIGGLKLNIDARNLDCVKKAVIVINNHIHDESGVISEYEMKILKALLGETWYKEYSIGKRHIKNI